MTQQPITELRLCKNPDCQREYQAEIINCMGVQIIRGDGYCQECAKKIYEADVAREETARLAKIASKRREWREVKSGIPSKFMLAEFGSFDEKRNGCTGLVNAKKRCLEFAEKWPFPDKDGKPWRYEKGYPSLLLYSESSWGIGKTHLACAIAHKVLNRWDGQPMACPVKFISEYELFSRIQASYNYNLEEQKYLPGEADIIREMVSAWLLIIDDVGKRRVQDPRFVQRIYFSIIDGRYKAERPIVITANLNPDKLKTYFGGGIGEEATFDRLFEMVRGCVIHIEGESYRRRLPK